LKKGIETEMKFLDKEDKGQNSLTEQEEIQLQWFGQVKRKNKAS
jgi:hypothetical protein